MVTKFLPFFEGWLLSRDCFRAKELKNVEELSGDMTSCVGPLGNLGIPLTENSTEVEVGSVRRAPLWGFLRRAQGMDATL
jgi:hypothetical protein